MGELALYEDEHASAPILRAGKSLALLVYLALSPDGKVPRRHLAELLWPDRGASSRQHCLRQAVYRLRQAAPDARLIVNRGECFEVGPDARFDFREGEEALARGDYDRAEPLLREAFLGDFSIPEAQEFERWAESRRTGLLSSWEPVALALTEEKLAAGDVRAAAAAGAVLARRRPYDDNAIGLLMAALAGAGQYALAVSRFQSYAELLRSEFGDEPSEELATYARELMECASSRLLGPSASSRLRERRQEWALLEKSWRDLPLQEGALVLLKGEIGNGKQHLIEAFAERAKVGGAAVFTARASEVGKEVPYATAARLLRPLANHPALEGLGNSSLLALTRLLPNLGERLPEPDDPAGESAARSGWNQTQELHTIVAELLARIADSDGLLLGIHELEDIDDASLHLLRVVVRALRGTRSLVVASYRPQGLGDEARRFIEQVVSDRIARLVRVGEFEVEEPRPELPEDREVREDRNDSDARVADYLRHFSGGSPPVLDGLIHDLEWPTGNAPDTPHFTALRRALDRISEGARY